ncbi:unnamed protein product [Calypogeia fissa]
MAAFLTDEELRLRAGDEVVAYVHELRLQVETHKARADAAVINAEQACSLIEQKFLSLTEQFGQLEHEKQQSMATLERRAGELAQEKGKSHKLELDAIRHHSELERLSFELGEVRKSKRDLLEIVDQKNAELDEKNASIKSFLDKIVSLTDERSVLEGKVREHDAELVRSHSMQTRLEQEKELLEQHNSWLNEELTEKVKGLMDERHSSAELEAELQSKLKQAERKCKEATEALHRSKERIGDLESKLSQSREELKFTKEQAVLQEDHLTAEIATATKLADLYKQSSDDWSNKSNELEGVVKAIETHLNQVESDYREKLDKEIQAREAAVKEVADLKEKLDKVLSDKNTVSETNADNFALRSPPKKISSELMDGQLAIELHGEGSILPSVAIGISGTALAAALLRDGWSLSTMYSKYHEAVDAWRHERHERKNAQSVLDRVLLEIERTAEVILDERAEHHRMIEAYRKMEEKLQDSMQDQNAMDNSIKDLKADLRKKERDFRGAQKEISDLQIQVAGLLKECADVKQRYEAGEWHQNGDAAPDFAPSEPDSSAADVVISEKLVSFKDIRGMVEQNSQLRILVRDLAQENEQKEIEMKEFYSAELNRRTEAAANKVAEVMRQYKEKEELIEALQGTVNMYKRLYEEQLQSRYSSRGQITFGSDLANTDDGGKDYSRLLQTSQEEIRSVRDEGAARVKAMEEELAKAKSEWTNARIERATVDAEAALAREQMVSMTHESENRRKEMDAVLLRNMEFAQTITNYQQQLREGSQRVHAAEEQTNKLKIEASILEKEKELLASAEKRASEEVSQLSDRVHRLQASLDTFQSIEETRESSRAAEVKNLQDELGHIQKEWTEARKELEVERRHSRDLVVARDEAVKKATGQVEEVNKELADALKAMSAAETRAQVAELRCTEVEANLKKADDKIMMALTGGKKGDIGEKTPAEIDAEILSNLQEVRDELEQVKEDLVAAKGHTEQYKRIAEANEEALKQLEAAHNRYKDDVEHMKGVMEGQVKTFQDKVAALESEIAEKEATSAAKIAEKELALNNAEKEMATLKESLSASQASLQDDEVKIKTLKLEVDKYHHQWREAQQNYERQILLQADTIRELTAASDRLTKLEQEEAALRIQAETAESQLASFQVSWAMEKSSLESMVAEAEKKRKDLDQQNSLLLDRLEAVHITEVEHGRKATAETGSSEAAEDKEENDLQNVIRYLRRSKETAETEVSLLKQERLRLQRQLDAALRAAEQAQSGLRREQEKARASLYSDEEFKSLQAQVREINLLRESNAQLREENRRNFEDSRESREKVRQANAELEPIQQQLREKEVELDAAGKELEMLRAENQRWQNRVSQILEKYKAIDVDDYERVKQELAELQGHLKSSKDDFEAARKEAEAAKIELEATRSKLEKVQADVNEKETRLNELEKKLQDALQAETTTRAELERFKRHAQFQKRKLDNLAKEKDDLSKEIEALSKQLEESKATAGKRASVEARQEAAIARLEQAQKESEISLKEKETRIQLLEKTLERERESVRNQKLLRQRDQKTFYDVAQKAVLEKKRFLEELDSFKREKLQQLEKLGNGAFDSELPRPEVEERAASYSAAVSSIIEVAGSPLEQIGQMSQAASPALAPPVAVVPPVLQSASINSTEAPQLPPVDANPLAVETHAGGSAASSSAVIMPSGVGAPVVSVSGPGVVGSMTGVVSSSVTSVVTTSVSVPRPPARVASSTVPTSGTRPPFRPPPAQPIAVPDQREREMAQLRAQIQEKEKSQAQASVTQARKTARRLIRPRIEPEVVTELGDSTAEASADVTETDLEPEEGKLTAVQSDAVETASTSALTVQMPGATAPAVDSTVPPSVTVNVSTEKVQPVSGLRKRPAVASEPNLTEDVTQEVVVKSESAPPLRRSRPVEQLPEEVSQESAPSAVTLLGGVKLQSESHDVSQDEKVGQELLVSDISNVPAPNQDAVTPGIASELERERPTSEISDIPPQKRPRFIRPEALMHSQQPIAKDEGVSPDDPVDDKMVFVSDDLVPETDLPKEAKGDAEVVDQGNFSLEISAQDQKMDLGDFSSSGEPTVAGEPQTSLGGVNVGGFAEEAALGAVTRNLSSVDAVDFARNGSEAIAKEVLSEQSILEAETRVLSSQVSTELMEVVPQVFQIDVPTGDSASQRESGVNIELSGTDEVQGVDSQPEEGEIPITVTAAETVPTFESSRDNVEIVIEVERPAEVKEEATAPAVVPVLDVPPVAIQEVQGLDIVLHPTEVKAAVSEVVSNVTTPADTGAQELKEPGEIPQPESGSMVIRNSAKGPGATSNTTIHLAERAKERAALRRVGTNPQSPAARGRGRAARGGKRAPGASRGGRVISTGVRGRGQAGGTPAASPEAARTGAQQGGSGAQGQTEQGESNTTPNPYETLPREGED